MIIAWVFFIILLVWTLVVAASIFADADSEHITTTRKDRVLATIIGVILTAIPAQYIWG